MLSTKPKPHTMLMMRLTRRKPGLLQSSGGVDSRAYSRVKGAPTAIEIQGDGGIQHPDDDGAVSGKRCRTHRKGSRGGEHEVAEQHPIQQLDTDFLTGHQ